jgi:CheY-like chemotaxis protein
MSDATGPTILAVDDEPGMRDIAQRILTRRGYRVLVADGPPQALAVAAAHDGPVDLLLTDVRMPTGSGSELAAELRRRLPDLAVLYMSGYDAGHAVAEGLVEAGARLVAKPFTPAALAEAVSASLPTRSRS